jgi:hypothetical protein
MSLMVSSQNFFSSAEKKIILIFYFCAFCLSFAGEILHCSDFGYFILLSYLGIISL